MAGLTNNDIFKKLRVAHKLKDTDIVDICKLVDFNVSTSELGAFFRSEDHPKYMECGDQILRNFLNGLVVHLRGPMPDKREEKPAKKQYDNTQADRNSGSSRGNRSPSDRKKFKR